MTETTLPVVEVREGFSDVDGQKTWDVYVNGVCRLGPYKMTGGASAGKIAHSRAGEERPR